MSVDSQVGKVDPVPASSLNATYQQTEATSTTQVSPSTFWGWDSKLVYGELFETLMGDLQT